MSIAPRGVQHIQITSVLLFLAIVTTYLRFIARRRARLEFRADDWTLLVAVIVVFAIYIEGLVCKGCLPAYVWDDAC